jgi:pyruvate dehydrogenase E2 component (dihydrolipoamide acetyltransferase)
MAEVIVMPKMNLTMEEGVLVEWCKKIGDHVKVEEVLCTIETEKSVVEMESPATGVLLKIWGIEGESYPVAAPIALIGEAGEDVSTLVSQTGKLLSAETIQEPDGAVSSAVPTSIPQTNVQVKMMPKVRKLVQALGIDLDALSAFCGDRKITEEEVHAFQQVSGQPSPPQIELAPGDRRVRMSTKRRTIAANMSESVQKTARLTNITEIDMTRAMEIINEQQGEKVSLTALAVKACALAIKDHEVINTVVDGLDIIHKFDIHIGIAVDMPDGLVVPVIRNADTKDLKTLSREISELAGKARRGNLTPEHFTGGTFTISNAGMLGLEIFTPIINYPQTAIMGIGNIRRLPRYIDDVSEILVPRFIMMLSLTYDHRVIDGAPAARFSLRVRDLLQNPYTLFQ